MFKSRPNYNLQRYRGGEQEKYVACMVLGAVGDCLGFRNGQWEFLKDGTVIHHQLEKLGGLQALSPLGFLVSDDTVMLIATARGLVKFDKNRKASRAPEEARIDQLMAIAKEYVDCMKDMNGRAPGGTCIKGVGQLDLSSRTGYIIPFNELGAGCGAAMRFFFSFFLFRFLLCSQWLDTTLLLFFS